MDVCGRSSIIQALYLPHTVRFDEVTGSGVLEQLPRRVRRLIQVRAQPILYPCHNARQVRQACPHAKLHQCVAQRELCTA